MIDGVVGVVGAAFYCLVAYIYGVFAGFRNVGLVGGFAGGLVLCRHGHACRASHEGVFAVVVDSMPRGKTSQWRCSPVFAVVLLVVVVRRVVVYNDLICLPVAFARCVDHCSGVLEHRDEVWHHDGLCEQIFGRSEQYRALPLPYLLVGVVVGAVACP